jgi:hypothetical protein
MNVKTFDVLETLIEKYESKKDVQGIVYKLSYAGKYVIIKGFTLVGSLKIVNNAYKQYDPKNERFLAHLYGHFFNHLFNTEDLGRFRIKTFAKLSSKVSQYKLLKREQMELDKARYDTNCLNNNIEAYIPAYNKNTHSFGWIDTSAVGNFKKYLDSNERKAYLKRYAKRPQPTPTKRGLSKKLSARHA